MISKDDTELIAKLPEAGFLKRILIKDDTNLAKEIRVISLNCNRIETIEDGHKLTGVQTLVGNDCRLNDIPEGLETLQALKAIELQRNDLHELPARLMQMATLQTVDASENPGLQTISTGESLKEINIQKCDILSLPSDFFQHNLEKVVMWENKNLRLLPSPGKNLKELIANDCNIQDLPKDFFQHALQMVDIRNNKGEKSCNSIDKR